MKELTEIFEYTNEGNTKNQKSRCQERLRVLSYNELKNNAMKLIFKLLRIYLEKSLLKILFPKSIEICFLWKYLANETKRYL